MSLNKLLNFLRVSDKLFVKIQYRKRLKKKLDLKNPQTFNEKLQWLKVYDHNPNYTMMVDKYLVRDYITKKIGEEYLVPLYGVYDSFDKIDFSTLPEKFVIKCNHDSGGLVICKDKSNLDIEKAREKINKCLKRNYYYSSREWPYKNVKPQIIIEKYMENSNGCGELSDYKIFCFNGKPEFTLVCSERFSSDNMCETFFDNHWNLMSLTENNHRVDKTIVKPKNFELMKKLASKLSADIPFVRIDFYEINNKLYFGEITFYPASGYEKFVPEEWNEKFGDMIKLPKRS